MGAENSYAESITKGQTKKSGVIYIYRRIFELIFFQKPVYYQA